VITYLHYMYRAPGSSKDVEIRSENWPDKTPADVLPLIDSVGNITTISPDNPDEHGEKREFKVLEIKPPITDTTGSWREGSQETVAGPNLVYVVVTDPD
jgi:hypothetical protein